MGETASPQTLEVLGTKDTVQPFLEQKKRRLTSEIDVWQAKSHYPDHTGKVGSIGGMHESFCQWLDNDHSVSPQEVWGNIVKRLRSETTYVEGFERQGVVIDELDVRKASPVSTKVVESWRWGTGNFASAESWDTDAVMFQRPKIKQKAGTARRFSAWESLVRLGCVNYCEGLDDLEGLTHELLHARHGNKDGEVRNLWFDLPSYAPVHRALARVLNRLETSGIKTEKYRPRSFNRVLYEAYTYTTTPYRSEVFLDEEVLATRISESPFYGFVLDQTKSSIRAMYQIQALTSLAVETNSILYTHDLANYEKSTAQLIYQWVSDKCPFDEDTKTFPHLERRISELCNILGIDRTRESGKKTLEEAVEVFKLQRRRDNIAVKVIAQEEVDKTIEKVMHRASLKFEYGSPAFCEQVDEKFKWTKSRNGNVFPTVFFPADTVHEFSPRKMAGYVFIPSDQNWFGHTYVADDFQACVMVEFDVQQNGAFKLTSKKDVPKASWREIYAHVQTQARDAVQAESIGTYNTFFRRYLREDGTSTLAIAAGDQLNYFPWQCRFACSIEAFELGKYSDRLRTWMEKRIAQTNSIAEKSAGGKDTRVVDIPLSDYFSEEEIGEIQSCIQSVPLKSLKLLNTTVTDSGRSSWVDNFLYFLGSDIGTMLAKRIVIQDPDYKEQSEFIQAHLTDNSSTLQRK